MVAVGKTVMRLIMGIAYLFTGGIALTACYGPPPVPFDPQVELTDFSYTPASPVRIGDRLSFEGRTNKPTDAGYVQVRIETDTPRNVWLNDNGYAPDETAGDGIWTGDLVWTIDLGTGENIPVQLELYWEDGHESQYFDGSPLTVLPEDEAVE